MISIEVKDMNIKEEINMKIMTININPTDKCHSSLKPEFKQMTIEERVERIFKIIEDKAADIIFFYRAVRASILFSKTKIRK